MLQLRNDLYQSVIGLLLPLVETVEDRREWLRTLLIDQSYFFEIRWEGSAAVFLNRLLPLLDHTSLTNVLATVGNRSGLEDRQEINRLVTQLNEQTSHRITVQTRPDMALLPYLVDRIPQQHSFDDSLTNLEGQERRPLVCVLHGTKKQSHEMLVHRLQRRYLSKKLPLKPVPVAWPHRLTDLTDFPHFYHRRLADALKERSSTSSQELQRQVTRQISTQHRIIYTPIGENDWRKWGLETAVQSFLSYWKAWPNLVEDELLLICLCIKYPDKETMAKRLHNILRRLFYRPQLVDKAAQAVVQIRPDPAVFYTPLPRLEDIRPEEVKDWVNKEVVDYCCIGQITDADIEAIFNNRPQLPMDDLAKPLEYLLTQFCENLEK